MGCTSSTTAAEPETSSADQPRQQQQTEEKKGAVDAKPAADAKPAVASATDKKETTFEDDLKWAKGYMTPEEETKLTNTLNIIKSDPSGKVSATRARNYYKLRFSWFAPTHSILFAAAEFARKSSRYLSILGRMRGLTHSKPLCACPLTPDAHAHIAHFSSTVLTRF